MIELTVKHPKVLRINFTGSNRVGRIIAAWAAECLKQCVLELGGKALVLVLDDACIEDAVEAVLFGAFANSGQICMSTERVIVHLAVAAVFRTELVRRVAEVRCENHLEESDISVSGLYTPSSCARIVSLVEEVVKQEAELLAGSTNIFGPDKSILEPIILDKVSQNMSISHMETCGPLISLTECGSEEQAVALANDSDFSLCAGVFSKDVMRALRVARRVRAGSCHVNGPTVYIEPTLPNGGTGGSSGYGRCGGVAGIEEFTEKKIISLAQPGMKYPF